MEELDALSAELRKALLVWRVIAIIQGVMATVALGGGLFILVEMQIHGAQSESGWVFYAAMFAAFVTVVPTTIGCIFLVRLERAVLGNSYMAALRASQLAPWVASLGFATVYLILRAASLPLLALVVWQTMRVQNLLRNPQAAAMYPAPE